MRRYVFGHSSFAGKTGISIEERQKGANSQWPEMAISSVPKRQVLLLSGQTDVEVRGAEIQYKGGRHACPLAKASRMDP
jgi:hypothetical protein